MTSVEPTADRLTPSSSDPKPSTPEKERSDSESPAAHKEWKCPDPGCKKFNINSAEACVQCKLPKNSACQFRKENREWRTEKTKFAEKKKLPDNVDSENPVIRMFLQHSKEWDFRLDKYERIVKLNRDITVESKRTIFLLHRIKSESDRLSTLEQAKKKLEYIRSKFWYRVAKELVGEDPYQYYKAYDGGLQEFVEAFSFHHFIQNGSLVSWNTVQSHLTFSTSTEGDCSEAKDKSVRVLVPKTGFILGLADLTGEIMRMVINSVGQGNTDACFELTRFLHLVHNGFTSISEAGFERRDMRGKIHAMTASIKKCEMACYTINVRGSEVPKHRLAGLFSKTEEEEETSIACVDDFY